MKQYVQFVGGPNGMYGAPKDLKLLGFYEVDEVIDCGFCTKIALKGMGGYFNAMWFKRVERSTVLTSKGEPKCGQPCYGMTFIIDGDGMKSCEVKTSPVQQVTKLPFGLFEVRTLHNLYTVRVA